MSEEKKSTWEKIGSGIGNVFSKGGVIIVAIAGIGVVAYLVYNYLNAGLDVAKNGYQNALKDLIDETKQFLKDNQANGIHGLTADQQAVINDIKQPQVDFWAKQLQNELNARNYLSNAISDVFVGLGIGAASFGVLAGISQILKNKGQSVKVDLNAREVSDPSRAFEGIDSWSQIDFTLQLTSWELALEGETGMASELQSALSTMYTTTMLPSLQTQSQVLQTELTTLLPGTVLYMTVFNMLSAINATVTYATIPNFIAPAFAVLPVPF